VLKKRPPATVSRAELVRTEQTKRITIQPRVLGDFLTRAAEHPWNEVAGLLLGRIHGSDLIIEDVVHVPELGSATRVRLSNATYAQAAKKAAPGQRIVGWIHSHPGHGVFLSSTDIATQSDGQAFFPDYAAIVMDPFHAEGAAYGFFRVKEGKARAMEYRYLVEDA